MTVQLYALAFQSTTTEAIGIVAQEIFRPYKMYTNVEGPGIAFIDALYVKERNEWAAREWDLWEFSTIHINALRNEFLEKHGLTGKPDSFVQAYLDDNELTVPDVYPLLLPTLEKGDRIRIVGRFSVPIGFSVFGHVPTKPVIRGRVGGKS